MERFYWPESADEKMRHFGTRAQAFSLNAHEKEFIRKNWENEYLLINTRERKEKHEGWCTHCHRWAKIKNTVSVGHLEKVRCPECDTETTVIHTWRRKGYMVDDGIFYLYRPSKINPEIVTCRLVWVRRGWHMEGKPIEFNQLEYVDSFYVFEPKKKAWQLRPEGNARILNKIHWHRKLDEQVYCEASRVKPRDWAYEIGPYGYNARPIARASDLEGAFEAAKESPLRYGMEEWFANIADDNFITYWNHSARYPAMEWLVKMGFAVVIQDVLSGSCPNTINFRGKTLERVFNGIKMTKEDKRFALKGLLHAEDVEFWEAAGGAVPLEMIWNYGIGYGEAEVIKELAADIPPRKLMRYIEKQRASDERNITLRDYRDYLESAKKLEWDVKEKRTLFPSRFWKAHDDAAVMVKQQKDRKMEERFINKRYPEMKKLYTFRDKALGMKIVIPARLSEYIREGKEMRNCVGGYCERIARGDTDVVFIRKIEEPKKSYITMEIKNGEIIQARTFANGSLDETGKLFVEKFKEKKLNRRRKSA